MKSPFLPCALFPALLLSFLSAAHSEPVPVANFSFEEPAYEDGKAGPTNSGWIGVKPLKADANGVEKPTFGPVSVQNFVDKQFPGATGGHLPAPADGDQAAVLGRDGLFYQDVGSLKPSTTYTLTVAVGARADLKPEKDSIEMVLANGSDELAPILASVLASCLSIETFEDTTLEFTTGAKVQGDLIVLIRSPLKNNMTQFDNVRLDTKPAKTKQ